MKKLRDLSDVIILYNLCLSRESCTTCPMCLGTQKKCTLPTIQENPSYIPTAIRLMVAHIAHDKIEAEYRRRLLFDETK